MTKVIAVHSFKGGTGKTTLTANLAATLALHHRVGVMDLDLFGTAVMVLLAETFEKPTFLTLNMVPPGVRIKDAVKVGKELATLFKSRFLQAFEFQMDVINNLSRSVFVVDNPDSSFAHKINEAAEMLTNELAEATQPAN